MKIIQTHCIGCGLEFGEMMLSVPGILCSDCSLVGLFRKKIVITGITRMGHGNICVSGVDIETWKFIRPVFITGLKRDFVMNGSVQTINHFNLVEIEFLKYRPAEEFHTEDWVVNMNFRPRLIKHLSEFEKLAFLKKVSITNLKQALEKKDKSLFVVKAKYIADIWHEHLEKFNVRVTFVDHHGNCYERFPVTDLLLLGYVKYMVHRGRNYSRGILSRFNGSGQRYVRIGLTRPYNGRPYWEQVTALMTMPDLFDGKAFSYYEKMNGGET